MVPKLPPWVRLIASMMMTVVLCACTADHDREDGLAPEEIAPRFLKAIVTGDLDAAGTLLSVDDGAIDTFADAFNLSNCDLNRAVPSTVINEKSSTAQVSFFFETGCVFFDPRQRGSYTGWPGHTILLFFSHGRRGWKIVSVYAEAANSTATRWPCPDGVTVCRASAP